MLREERERWEDMTTGSQGQGSRRLAGNEQLVKTRRHGKNSIAGNKAQQQQHRVAVEAQ